MAQSSAPGSRGPKNGPVRQRDLVRPNTEFDGLEWGDCTNGKQYAPITRQVGGREISAVAERPCKVCTSSGCPWRGEYRFIVKGR